MAAEATAGVAFGGDPPAGESPLLVIADLDDSRAIAWLDRGVDVACVSAGPALLAARIDAVLRQRTVGAGSLNVGPLAIDLIARTVVRAHRTVPLLPREYRLLLHLAHHAGQVVSRADLCRAVWSLGFDPGTNVVSVHVSQLRARIDRGYDGSLIQTVKGIGYRLAT